jgi:pimeloyl-ACP methyl ester carboxylesterase
LTAATVRTVDGAELSVEAIGNPEAPAILLIGGATWSRDWWDDELCARLAGAGRLVVRYDARATGESTSYPAGAPGYTGADMVADAIAVLDHLGIGSAHVVGLSMGGGIAQRLGLDHPERVASLTLISTGPIEHDGELPGIAPELEAAIAGAPPESDWSDRDAVVAHIVEAERPYAAPGAYDAERVRAVAERVVDRSRDVEASMKNHFLIDDGPPSTRRLGELGAIPTLVLHGSDDPLLPPAHGRALAASIPGARFVELDRMGHELPPPRTWDVVIPLLVG